ncbi:spore cortex biosynthesis protein YabQ [Paenibacillus pini]|nr:spore cortex biosynthesis protein YabQ [Paenibacillus pini]
MNPQIQWITLLWMLFSGVAMGMAYDSYRVLSGQLHFPKWTLHLLDLLYWSAAAVFVFRMLYISNYGQLRFYVFVGLFIGVWVYFLILSVTTQRFVVMLIGIVKRIVTVLKNIFQFMIWTPILVLYSMCRGIIRVVGRLIMFLLHIVIQCVLPFWKLLNWMLRPITSRLKKPRWLDKAVQAVAIQWKRWFHRE